MRLVSLFFGLLIGLCACSSNEDSTFGLSIRHETEGRVGAMCTSAGNAKGGSALKLDPSEGLPDLWVEDEQNFAEDRAYKVRLYIARAYVPGTTVPSEKEVLVERRYDEAFGRTGGTDSMEATFEGQTYRLSVTGLAASAQCPPYEAGAPPQK